VLSFEAHDVVRDGELISYVMNQNYASLTNVVMERGYGSYLPNISDSFILSCIKTEI